MSKHELAGSPHARSTASTYECDQAPYLRDRVDVLYFAQQQVWPINSGARMRNYHLAHALASRASVTFAELGHAGEEMGRPPADSGFEKVVSLHKGVPYSPFNLLRGLAGPTPITVLNCWSADSAAKLENLLASQKFDTIQIEGVHLLQYLPIIQRTMGRTNLVVDWHNIESELMWRYAETTSSWLKQVVAKRTAKLIENAEDRLIDACGTHLVTSEREREKLLQRHPAMDVHVVPNGVDAASYSQAQIAEICQRSKQAVHKPTILFVGSMDYHANVDAVTWFSRTAWPEISRNYPNLHFTIVGRNPTAEVRALATDRIHVTGTVEDVRPFYASSLAVVVPLRSGSGTRLKILEAMAAGMPVVSTQIGIEGIDAEAGLHYHLADSAEDLAAAVGALVSSPAARTEFTAAARALVTSKYDWPIIGEQLYRIHSSLAPQRESKSLQTCP